MLTLIQTIRKQRYYQLILSMMIQTHNVIHYFIAMEVKIWCTQVKLIPCHLFQKNVVLCLEFQTNKQFHHTSHLLLQSWKCFFQYVSAIHSHCFQFSPLFILQQTLRIVVRNCSIIIKKRNLRLLRRNIIGNFY